MPILNFTFEKPLLIIDLAIKLECGIISVENISILKIGILSAHSSVRRKIIIGSAAK
jgi:hypothetical protein